jgi:hypothetical protein
MNLITQYAPNQILIETDEAIYLQSYSTVVARYNKDSKSINLGYDWDYSRTTMKYVKRFIKECATHQYTNEMESNPDSNNFTVADLRRALETGLVLLGIPVHFEGSLQEQFSRI